MCVCIHVSKSYLSGKSSFLWSEDLIRSFEIASSDVPYRLVYGLTSRRSSNPLSSDKNGSTNCCCS